MAGMTTEDIDWAFDLTKHNMQLLYGLKQNLPLRIITNSNDFWCKTITISICLLVRIQD